ncbi:spindle pole body component 110-like [Nicotiana sylvestris]|uniref:spindle pole body component 110-like n=1 Tax=Nicotiana sylvestris TaxID=4096 RepID=UPI00388C428C
MELSQNITGMALRTLITETEREHLERRRMAIYEKMSSKYQRYRAKHRAMADIYNQDPEFQLFREGLKQREDQLERKIEELRERDEELMKVVARNSELEASLKAVEVEGLKGELNVGADKLAASVSGTASLENALRVCRSELTEEKEASNRKVAGLEGRGKELEAELYALNGQVASLREKDASRRS